MRRTPHPPAWSLCREADDTALTPRDRLLVQMVDGWYHAISYVCNAARVPLEPWAKRW